LNLTDLALQRAEVSDLKEFQVREGLVPSGKEDVLTMQRLAPYLLGYDRYMIKPGDTYYSLAKTYGTNVPCILMANPNGDPNRLIPGEYLNMPMHFPVVPTTIPMTSELMQLCIQGLIVRYPFLLHHTLAVTKYGRSVPVLHMGLNDRAVLYNASHHANEWITSTILLKFLEDYAYAVSTRGKIFGVDALTLFRNSQLYLVPMVNPDGVDLVTGAIATGSEQYLAAQKIAENYPDIPFPDGWKANLLGVDLNLNYPADWDTAKEIKFEQGFTSPAPRDYVGSAALDQLESVGMVEFTSLVNPILTLSYHTQGEVIYWKFLDKTPAGAEAIGEEFAQVSGYKLDDVPYASGFAGYKDWFIQDYQKPGFTIEAGLGENPLPLSDFDSIYEKNIGILTLGLQLP
jgi:g-D-glutamyl-meso-diaminopimelate peptidase